MDVRIVTDHITVPTRGDSHIVDITPLVTEVIRRHGMKEGQALVFVPGSTASVTTIELEEGLMKDFPDALERLVPRGIPYAHEEAWHDGNGHSHVRASLMGPSLTVPFRGGELLVGTWQQVVLVDFDVRPRHRDVVIQLIGT